MQNTFDSPRATQVTNPIAANIASGGPALPAAAFVDTVALPLPGAEEVAPSMLIVEGPPPARTPLEVATEDVLAGEDVVVIAIRELMAVDIDIAGSMDIPGIDIAVSIEVVGIDMPGSVGDSLPVGQLNSWYFNWYFIFEILRQYSSVVRATGIIPYQLGYQL